VCRNVTHELVMRTKVEWADLGTMSGLRCFHES
jgi:hypothetical protein